jgi:hypothetical protein
MTQILKTPDKVMKDNNFNISRIYLVCFTFIAQTCVYLNDIRTITDVMNTNPGYTPFSIIGGGIFWFILLTLTIGCVQLDRKKGELWDEYEKIFKAHESD